KCTATHKITEADILNGKFVNTATADSDQTDEVSDTKTVTTVDPSRGLTLVKKADPAVVTTAPTTVTYSFEVKNTGNQTLTDVTIDDPMLAELGITIPTISELKPGKTKTVTATYEVDQGRL